MIRNPKKFKIALGLILTLQSVIALGFLAYAFYERSRNNKLVEKLDQLQEQVDQCRVEAHRQMELSKKVTEMAMRKAEKAKAILEAQE
ncbi:MAG: hypothetical protein AAGF85_08175 [Bacteroidota bacterium]